MRLDQPVTGAWNDLKLSVQQAIGQLARRSWRRGRVGRSGDDERRAGDLLEPGATVEVQERARDRRDPPPVVSGDSVAHKCEGISRRAARAASVRGQTTYAAGPQQAKQLGPQA